MVTLVDCTLRDGGYYTRWDFPRPVIERYLEAMAALAVDYVEIGFRFTDRDGFRGACAYASEAFLAGLDVPEGLRLGVMVNASDVVGRSAGIESMLQAMFAPRAESRVELVRIACHLHEFEEALQGCSWLKSQGYTVGINLMQIADRSPSEIEHAAEGACAHPIDVLYFADSMGGMTPEQTASIISVLRRRWSGPLGIHTHDNMGNALANTLRAIDAGATWVDSTVTGMGRGPGNAKTEYLALELDRYDPRTRDPIPLMRLIRKVFRPMQVEHGWGTNAFYYLAGKYSIHPTYIQEMLADPRYGEEDLFAAIAHLKDSGGRRYDVGSLRTARSFFVGAPRGSWLPKDVLQDRDVLILGAGPSVAEHRDALEDFIQESTPYVIALNTQRGVSDDLIDARAACHPVRLLADSRMHRTLPQPLIAPLSMLPEQARSELAGKAVHDYGVTVVPGTFAFSDGHCTLPSCLVIAYALAAATSGAARGIYLAGFDGFPADDPRKAEMDTVFDLYRRAPGARPIMAITPTSYGVPKTSVYAIREAH